MLSLFCPYIYGRLSKTAAWPFGNHTGLIVDYIHQYLPFYAVSHDKLQSGKSLLYSFSGGPGFNFWSAIAYYLADSLNILLYFVPVEHVCDLLNEF